MKFGQLLDYNIFLQKSYTKYGGETIHRTLKKIKIKHISELIVISCSRYLNFRLDFLVM